MILFMCKIINEQILNAVYAIVRLSEGSKVMSFQKTSILNHLI